MYLLVFLFMVNNLNHLASIQVSVYPQTSLPPGVPSFFSDQVRRWSRYPPRTTTTPTKAITLRFSTPSRRTSSTRVRAGRYSSSTQRLGGGSLLQLRHMGATGLNVPDLVKDFKHCASDFEHCVSGSEKFLGTQL